MILEPTTLLLASVGYLAVLFGVAEVAERSRWVRERVTPHPLVYSLSLCVYATSWTFYGSVGYARDHGFTYAAIGLGVALSALLIPWVWQRVQQLVEARQLTSVADLFAYRYSSQALGVAVTVLLVCGSLPYLALQFRAVSEALAALTGKRHLLVGGVYLALVTLFALLFGIRHDVSQRQHPGLIVAIALESLVKLAAILLVVAVGVAQFGGVTGLETWVSAHPEAVERLFAPVRQEPWVTLLLLSVGAGFLLPRQFHMAFAECSNPAALRQAAWLLPALMMGFYAGTPVLLWAGEQLAPNENPELHVLTLAAQHPAVALLTFIGGLSASSAMIIVSSLALSSMLLNHVALPLRPAGGDLYRGLRWARRLLAVVVTGSGFLVFAALDYRGGLVELGLTAFVATAQLIPGLIGVLWWRQATSRGVLVGLLAGALAWGLLMLPVLFYPNWDLANRVAPGLPAWATATYLSVGLNAALMVGLSLSEPARVLTRTADASERMRGSLDDLRKRLSPLLGSEAAALELDRARRQLGLSAEVLGGGELEQLAARVERNLTALVGPLMARALVGQRRRRPHELAELISSMGVPSVRMEPSSAAVASVQQMVDRVLDELPVGLAALDSTGDTVMWNQWLARLSGLDPGEVLGSQPARLPDPWCRLIGDAPPTEEPLRHEVTIGGERRVLELTACQAGVGEDRLCILVVDDLTEQQALQTRLEHQDRLASLGRLSAGLAHEIGNPLTGLMMVAQNLEREVSTEPMPAVELQARLGQIVEQGRRIRGIVSSLKDFSRSGAETLGETLQLQEVRVGVLFQEAVEIIRLSGQARAVLLELTGALDTLVCCDSRRVIQVLTNLVDNACHACSDAERPSARVCLHASVEQGGVSLDVVDDGCGIAAEQLPRVFEPFFTSRPGGEGTGLGLSVARGIAHEHRGTLQVVTTGTNGTTMRLWLPQRGGDSEEG